ncbi:MAG TPA: DUF6634 family protein [Ramlibacter sp.]|jgi:hypothetical protein
MVSHFLGNDPLKTAESLEQLANDLRRLAAGKEPSQEQVAQAPLLRQWCFHQQPRYVLMGTSYGHPQIADGKLIVTSEIFAVDAERQWARTLSRYYALGPITRVGLTN